MRKLSVKNNWETYEYYADDERINPKEIKTIFINGVERNCITKSSVIPYTDWGHQYYANRTTLYTVIKDFMGIEFITELTDIIQQGKVFIP